MPDQQLTPEQIAELKEKLKSMSPEQLRELQKQNCIFCQIASGKIPSKTVYEDDKCLAVLDIYPANPGHVLLVPKEHYMIMPQVPELTLQHLLVASKHISHAILRGLKATGVNLFIANGAIAGQRAQHFIIHLIPRKEDDGINFDLQKKELSEETITKLTSLFKKNESEKVVKEEKVEVPKPEVKKEEIKEPKKQIKEKKKAGKKTKKKPEEESKPQKNEISLDDIAKVLSK
ncbi:MAG: HIT domain-containing protein [Candidatus Woesearchaeota archaeon]